MKLYALIPFLLVILMLTSCGEKVVVDQEAMVDVSTEISTEETVVEETLNVESVEEDFSPGEQEDDYGDII